MTAPKSLGPYSVPLETLGPFLQHLGPFVDLIGPLEEPLGLLVEPLSPCQCSLSLVSQLPEGSGLPLQPPQKPPIPASRSLRPPTQAPQQPLTPVPAPRRLQPLTLALQQLQLPVYSFSPAPEAPQLSCLLVP